MAKQLDSLTSELQEFIEDQKIFFVGTAMSEGRINVSPKGMDSFRVVGDNRVVWLSVSGAENETAAHLLENDRMTIMFSSFEGEPLILRLFGHARAIHPRDAEWDELVTLFPQIPGTRQIYDMEIDRVLASCGKAVPYFDFVEEREDLNEWATRVGEEGVKSLWERKNQVSMDGKPSGLLTIEPAPLATPGKN